MNKELQLQQAKAVAAINRGRYKEAEILCNIILKEDADFPDAWFLKAMCASARMNIGDALKFLDKTLELAPNNPEYLAQYAKLNCMVNLFRPAKKAADAALQNNPDQALTLDTIGVVYTKIGEFELAKRALSKAVRMAPKNPQFYFNLGSVYQFLGNHRKAEKGYLKAIQFHPRFSRAYWALSELMKESPKPVQIKKLKELLEYDDLSPEDELYLCHALAREVEKKGNYKKAFKLLERGKVRFRAKLKYDRATDEQLFDAVKKQFPLPVIPSVDAWQGKDAIFIVGMPRSGTTLVERIISSHSEVESLGELQNFGLAVRQSVDASSRSMLDKEVAEATGTLDFQKVGARYIRSLSNRIDASKRFTDKLPLNFLFIGHILESLPAAKIICVQRNPMDTCLSNYRQLFAVTYSYYNYHYDLEDTGNYYCLFADIMRFWQKHYQQRIHFVEYEELIQNPEQQSRKMLEYCELDWQQECLDFHNNKAVVTTASAMQVRQPIYQSSLNRWKEYEDQLDSLKKIFDAKGIEY